MGVLSVLIRNQTTLPRCGLKVDDMGLLPDSRGLYPRLTPMEHIEYFGRLHGIDGPALTARAKALLTRLGLNEFANRRVAGFSQGERTKVALARALVHQPRNVILDEPTNGLDVMSTRAMREIDPGITGDGWWPMAPDRDSARRIATYGATAVFFMAGLTTILALISLFKPLSQPLDYIRPEAVVNAFMFAFLGLMIQWKVSRIAAVGAAVLYVFEQVYAGIHGWMGFVTALWAVIFLWAFVSAVRGTFAFHAHRRGLSTASSELRSL